ncbi:MAG: isocitrate dehydrogenase (NAD(+)) [Acidobacteria bacterium]|nr:MAG: isocitrate dehydrogenase (NAD(+)) [Acidobacteriota bacterium]
MKHKITLIPGDGIGPEVTNAALKVIEAAGIEVEWEVLNAGVEAFQKSGRYLPDELLNSIRCNHVAIKGPISTPIGEGFSSINVTLRKALNLYASFRPIKNLPGVKTRFDNVDIIVVRENTEDLYSGLEHVVVPGVVESLKIITAEASTRIARFAFEYARRKNRKKISAIHKANIMKLSDGLFLECVRNVARLYPEIQYEELIVDNACMQMVLDPTQFDVMLLENLYGDIVSDLGAGLVGGLGLVPGANLGEEWAVFEPVHGSAPKIAGKNLANPTAMMLSAVLMFQHLGETEKANRIAYAIEAVYQKGKTLTSDLGGTATTTQFAEAVVQHLVN